MRNVLTGLSNAFRRTYGLETTYEEAGSGMEVMVTFTIHSQIGTIDIDVDTVNLLDNRITEVVVMNEQGAHHFDQYIDSSGISLQGDEIGCWDQVTAQQATFVSESHQLTFSLDQVKGARLFRGRELIGNRLAWAGFGP